ncbi:hypothetical protein EDB81DRAFT_851905 [Dactylonectria macrodidyma]|uniref:NACHT domain-containing protein n=1 Tax=Dactylonectria macrodidyma TaxID=307937 RepID=A0A9P9FSS7_9HYPO|nr:hypothetical protein EDB81DRAFT_851905 [Dactylonectria macrodidyma]
MAAQQPSSCEVVTVSRPPVVAIGHTDSVKELEATLARFQQLLTDNDRKTLDGLDGSSYDTQSIITFTASLDGLDPNRRGKSIATRLSSFLQTIQQFSPIVDTMVSSNPHLAALIWGSIKFTFHVLANITSYFESFVKLLHGFGSLCSRFAEYQLLYTNSPRLKDSICSFHSAVIACCEQIVIVVRRPLKSQAWKVLTQSFQAELSSFVDDIRAAAENVQQDIQLVKAQTDYEEQQSQTKEREEAAENRSQLMTWLSSANTELRMFGEEMKRRKTAEKRRRLLQNLSSFNFVTPFVNARNKRHKGTTEWVVETPEFKSWYGYHTSHILHITGKIGSGKSILASKLVDHLCQSRRPRQFNSFFFCRFDQHDSLQSDTIIRSLLQQLLSAFPFEELDHRADSGLVHLLEEAKSKYFSLPTLMELYYNASLLYDEVFVVLDGIDECNVNEQRAVFGFFAGMMAKGKKPPKIKLLLSSRETTQSDVNRFFPSASRLTTGYNHTSEDIMTYAEDVLRAKQATNELGFDDESLIERILDAIASKEEGMFIWVALTIDDICSRQDYDSIKKALLNIPTDLAQTFDRALQRIVQSHHQDLARDIFQWTAAVHQPLTQAQLEEALAVEIGQRSREEGRSINSIKHIGSACQNLVYVDDVNDTVHFSHHSIRQFLLRPNAGEFANFHFKYRDSDLKVGEVCATYLNFGNFKTTLTRKTNGAFLEIPLAPLAGNIVQMALPGRIGARIGRLAEFAVRSPSRSTGSASKPEPFQVKPPKAASSVSVTYPFLEYAAENFFHHIKSFRQSETASWNILGRILAEPPTMAKIPWMDPTWRSGILKLMPFDGYFETSLKSVLEGHQNGTSSTAALTFAAVYAGGYGNLALGCRALIALSEDAPDSETLSAMLNCPNQCIQVAAKRLGHEKLITAVTECIAGGIESWPPSTVIARACYCRELYPKAGLRSEICRILENGYTSSNQPYLQVQAKVATGRQRHLTFESICNTSGVAPEYMCQPGTGQRVIELAAEHGSARYSGCLFIQSFLDFSRSRPDKILFSETLEIARHGFRSALRHGVVETTELFIKILPSLGPFGMTEDDKTLDAITCAMRFPWPAKTTARIIAFFGPLYSHPTDTFLFTLFEIAIGETNWAFAKAVVAHMSYCGHSGAIGLLYNALQCNNCKIVPMVKTYQPIEQLPVDKQALKLCEKHKTEARSNLVLQSPSLNRKYDPSQVALRTLL